MKDYRSIDTAALTLDDALADEVFHKDPWDYYEFIAINADVMESIDQDFTLEEAGEVLKILARYCNTGNYPDYSQMSTTAVKATVRTLIHAHDMRMKSEYLRHYRQFVTSQQKKQEREKK